MIALLDDPRQQAKTDCDARSHGDAIIENKRRADRIEEGRDKVQKTSGETGRIDKARNFGGKNTSVPEKPGRILRGKADSRAIAPRTEEDKCGTVKPGRVKSCDHIGGIAKIDDTGIENVAETKKQIGQSEYPDEIAGWGEARDSPENEIRKDAED